MLRTRLSDIEPTETTNKKAKTGETIRHLHYSGIKFWVLILESGESGACLKV